MPLSPNHFLVLDGRRPIAVFVSQSVSAQLSLPAFLSAVSGIYLRLRRNLDLGMREGGKPRNISTPTVDYIQL